MVQVGEKNYEVRVVESTEDVGCFTLGSGGGEGAPDGLRPGP